MSTQNSIFAFEFSYMCDEIVNNIKLMIKRYSCGEKYCTPDKINCDKSKKITGLDYITLMDYIHIDSCPTSTSRVLKKKEVCILNKNCLATETKTVRNNLWKMKKQVECPCPISHKYKCNGTIYCTKDKFSCNLIQKLTKDTRKQMNFKYCLTNKKYLEELDGLRQNFGKHFGKNLTFF